MRLICIDDQSPGRDETPVLYGLLEESNLDKEKALFFFPSSSSTTTTAQTQNRTRPQDQPALKGFDVVAAAERGHAHAELGRSLGPQGEPERAVGAGEGRGRGSCC